MNKFIFALCALILSSEAALADGYLKIDGLYKSSETKDNSGTSKGSETLINAGLGYISQGRWVLGGIYAMEKVKNGSTTVDRTSMGPTVGWMSGGSSGFYILASYFFASEFGDYEGTGYEADLGYKFSVGRVSLAPQISYKSFKYEELNGAELATPLEQSNIDPYFVLIVEF